MNTKYKQELISILVNIKDSKLMTQFIEDILTPVEFEKIITRWQIIKQLAKGVPQREIAKRLRISIAKITRGSRELRDKNGGFNKILNREKN